MGFNCLQATEPLQGSRLIFATKFPDIPGTHLINFQKDERLSQPSSHPAILNTVPLDRESTVPTYDSAINIY